MLNCNMAYNMFKIQTTITTVPDSPAFMAPTTILTGFLFPLLSLLQPIDIRGSSSRDLLQ